MRRAKLVVSPMVEASIQIGERRIGAGSPCFVIAEAGVNHNGDLRLARQLVEAAAEAGADAVKFQTFQADRVVAPGAPKAEYQKRTSGAEESQLEMLKRLELSEDDHRALIEHSSQAGIVFLSTPFDESSADLLHRLGVPAFKLPSGEITNLPFLEHVARKGLPILLSTGMSTLAEVDEAVRAIRDAANPPLALLHCVSNYPASPSDVNLRAMDTMRAAFSVPIGYSDHTLGDAITLAAVARGASIIEKHFTLDRGLPGPDHQASLEPGEIAALVRSIRSVEESLGTGRKEPAASESGTAAAARKSIAAARDLPAGHVIAAEDLARLRPGTGLAPAMLRHVVGRILKRPVERGELFCWEDFG